jgi:hypothetical protein
VPINKSNALKSGIAKQNDDILNELLIDYKSGVMYKNDLAMLAIISTSQFKRPICFTSKQELGKLGIDKYVRLRGISYELVPFKVNNAINTEASFNNVMTKFSFGNAKDSTIYFDEENRHVSSFNQFESNEKKSNKLTKKEKELAAKYPEIKTYTAIGMENPSHVAKLDVGPMGFNAMVLSNDGRYFIDPVFVNNKSAYISYFRKDLPTWANTFNCNVIADEQFELENKNRLEAYLARNNSAVVTYRVYRLALACTFEYAKASTSLAAPTKAQVLAKMVTSMNRVNGVYETDVAVHMNLVAKNDTLVFISGTDPYTNSNGSTMLSENQSTVNSRIGSANYDIGHVFSTGGGGIASLGSVCVANRKAQGVTGSPSPVGDAFDIDYVAHEMGHQFAGNHTFNSVASSCNGNRSSSTSFEPGSGTTVMAYAGICGNDDIASNSDPYFHAGSLDEINAFIATTANACAAKTVTTNNQPIVNAGPDYVIPISTPFQLSGTASDPDSGDVLSYSWEQMDLGPQGSPNSATGNAPLFRFFPPKNTGKRMFPQLSNVLANSTTLGERLPSYARNMKFRLTARDNKPNAGATGKDEMNITVSASAGPFALTSSNTIDTFLVGSSETITWNVNNTNAAPVNCALVRI